MTMCRVLNVARAGFYAWLHNPVSARDKDNQRLLMLIRDSYSLSGGVYGYRRVHGDLNEIGETCGKNRVGRIMQQNRIKAVRGYKAPRRIAGRPSVVALIACNGSLLLSGPIRSGSQILLISAPGRAGCIWRWLSISSPVMWSAGR
jgi:putative transposase